MTYRCTECGEPLMDGCSRCDVCGEPWDDWDDDYLVQGDTVRHVETANPAGERL